MICEQLWTFSLDLLSKPDTTFWDEAVPSCPSAAHFAWALFHLPWVSMDTPGLPLLSLGRGQAHNIHSFNLPSSAVQPLLLIPTPQPLLQLSLAADGPDNGHGRAGMDGGNLRQEGSGWHCHSQHLRIHQQDSNPLPLLHRLGFGLGLGSENQIFREFSCRTPSAWSKCSSFF